jgi:protein SCO1
MLNRLRALALTFTACALAACANGGGLVATPNSGGGGGSGSPLPADTIGILIPTSAIGVENDPVWGTVSGFTQTVASQVLAFPPGTKITLQNLSSVDPHTFNVIAATNGPPAKFPQNPTLDFNPKGHGQLGTGYASGIINPMQSVTVTLSKPGIYLVGCAFHYGIGMRDVIQVSASATPGPQATAPPSASPSPAAEAAPLPPLADQTGRAFTLASLRGAPAIVTFVSAHCTDACPLIDAQFAAAARELRRRGSPAHLVTITLDPEHDSPSLMRAMAREFGADPRTWLVADGAPANVNAIARAFGVVAIAGKSGYRERHTTYVYVLDASGRLAKTMLASTDLAEDMVAELAPRTVAAAP